MLQLSGTATKIVLGVAGLSAISLWTYLKHREWEAHKRPTEKWHQIGHVKEIAVYPCKSGAALQLEQARCDVFGLSTNEGLRDRSLLILHEKDGSLARAGIYPSMLSIRTENISGQQLSLTAPNMKALDLDLNAIVAAGTIIVRKKQGYRQSLVECAGEQHRWISQAVLQKDTGLQMFVELEPEVIKSWWRTITNNLNPVMMMHDKSMQQLNKRLLPQNVVHHQQFRGNLFIASDDKIPAYDEDKWLWVRIGRDTILHFQAPCLRCILPNINLKNFARNTDHEPLRTLKVYRLRSHPKEPEMGVYYSVHQAGLIRQGDPVFVQYK